MADDFTRRQFKWLDQIADDSAVTAAGFILAYRIAKHLNRGTGDAWPSQTRLATEMRITVRGVRGLSDQLEAAGHLTVIASQGRGHSCRYRPIVKGLEDESAPAPVQEVAHTSSHTIGEELLPGSIDASPKATPAPKKGQTDFTSDFEAWWLQYPRKVSKGSARKAYDVARQGGATADALVMGVMRYAAARTGEDPKYTKHATTWLNGEGWLDEPEPAAAVGPARSYQQRPAPLSHLEIALAGLDRDE